MADAKKQTAITPTRSENYPEWYQQVIRAAELAENSPTRGCMVIRPWGFAIWENIQKHLDRMFKETGHVNAYFPLLIPLSFLEQEAKHVEGFAKECAVVTHHRLEQSSDGKLIPKGELEEPFIIRPTSETIIGAMYAKWVNSYRDLPILINQWANVFRWEMRTRLFLRTAEFLWQEGHTCHATAKEAEEETLKMLDVYATFCRDYMAMPVIKGEKTADERFPGAVNTYAVEAMMQDRKALQAGTSHFLGQNFSRAQQIKFLDAQSTEQYAWTTSWGVSTRLIGGLIMTHSDDDGLVLPPRLAPAHAVILPIYRNDDERNQVLAFCQTLAKRLREQKYCDEAVRVIVDDRDLRGGEKIWQHVKKGVPLRIEIGPRDITANAAMVARRDQEPKAKQSLPIDQLVADTTRILQEIQDGLLRKATAFRDANIQSITSLAELEAFFAGDEEKTMVGQTGFALCHWHPDADTQAIMKRLKISARCIPMELEKRSGSCIFSGKATDIQVIFARSY